MDTIHLTFSFCILITLSLAIVIVPLSGQPHVANQEFIVVDHETCLSVNNVTYACIDPTHAFYLNATEIYSWMQFDKVTVRHSILWVWVDPYGRTYTQLRGAFGNNGPGGYVQYSYVNIWDIVNTFLFNDDHANFRNPFGNWSVRIYVDQQYLLSDNFTLSTLEMRVPLASSVPSSDDPFGATWGDAVKVRFNYQYVGDSRSWDLSDSVPSPVSYLYAKYTALGSKPRLFLYFDCVLLTNRTMEQAFDQDFDTRNDGNINVLANPDDFWFTASVNTTTSPPYISSVIYSLLGKSVAEQSLFRWDFGSSENGNQPHLKGYAEIPMSELRKYPNPSDPSTIGFNAGFEEEVSPYQRDHSAYIPLAWRQGFLLFGGIYAEMIFTNTTVSQTTSQTTQSTTETSIIPTQSTSSLQTQIGSSAVETNQYEIGYTSYALLGGIIVAAILLGSLCVRRRRKREIVSAVPSMP